MNTFGGEKISCGEIKGCGVIEDDKTSEGEVDLASSVTDIDISDINGFLTLGRNKFVELKTNYFTDLRVSFNSAR
ncbi:MAG: hypothetical protein Q8P68_04225 [Candidatus Peregrinibacteria bacterium]|nr:hypothetical protein [Candidatus Peregrinibacteria bacterium]